AEAFADDLQRDTRAAAGRFPSSEEQELAAVETGNRRDRVGERRGGGVRIGESAAGSVDGDKLERGFLRDGHHHLLQFCPGPKRDEPELAARILCAKVCGFVERARGPWVEDGGKNHFVLQAGTCRAVGRLEGLQWVR